MHLNTRAVPLHEYSCSSYKRELENDLPHASFSSMHQEARLAQIRE
jgi:hypothetical protein